VGFESNLLRRILTVKNAAAMPPLDGQTVGPGAFPVTRKETAKKSNGLLVCAEKTLEELVYLPQFFTAS
jgi:hypothetical protein